MSVQTLSPEHQKLLEQLRASNIKPPLGVLEARKVAALSCVDFGEKYFYIPETKRPLIAYPTQRILLQIISGQHTYKSLLPFYSTVEWSSVKKTGKTAISGAYARWRAEQLTSRDEILFFANDETQSRGRAYAAIQTSLELDPNYDVQKRVLLGESGLGAPSTSGTASTASTTVRWRIIEDYLEHVPTQTKVRAVNVDYRGEAGANPTLTVWTECWGYDTDKQFKLFEEMTPVLTRQRSQRYLEGYAGYTGKSKVQQYVEDIATKDGRQLTIEDIPDWPCVGSEVATGLLPIWVNDQAGVFAYLDRGPNARQRVPWTQGPEADMYYQQQALLLPPEQMDRLHFNQWISPTSAFIPIEWMYACKRGTGTANPNQVPPLDKRTPIILAVDASVSGDCTALVAVSRDPTSYQDVCIRFAYVWTPPRGGKLDYITTENKTGESLLQVVERLCATYNVTQIAYDEYQLHHFMNEIRLHKQLAWCRPFSQSTARDIADKQLYDLIKHRRISYDHLQGYDVDLEKHVMNAAKKQKADEDTKMHIIKSSEDAKIDMCVALSMACAECLRLDL